MVKLVLSVILFGCLAGCVTGGGYGYGGYASPPIRSRTGPLPPMGQYGHPDAIQNRQNATLYGNN
jgi:hypothetical protein